MRRNWLQGKIRKRVIVYTVDEQAIEGYLMEAGRDGVHLINVQIHAEQDIPLDGDIFVPRENIRMVNIIRSSRRS